MNAYSGTGTYIASPDLMDSVNVAIALSRPLLVKGEPGTGKTLLAHSVAENLKKRDDRLEHQVHHQGPGRASMSTIPSSV